MSHSENEVVLGVGGTMLEPPIDPQFRDAIDLFISFLYAAALDVVITHYLLTSPRSESGLGVLLLFVLFLASDWASKVRARRLITEKFSTAEYFWKTAFELVCLFCLIVTFVYLLEDLHRGVTAGISSHDLAIPLVAFGVFALFSGFWDFVLIKTVALTWRGLMTSLLSGQLDRDEHALQYVTTFERKRSQAKVTLRTREVDTRDKLHVVTNRPVDAEWPFGVVGTAWHMLMVHGAYSLTVVALKCGEALTASLVHFVGLHVALLNIVVGVAMLLQGLVLHQAGHSLTHAWGITVPVGLAVSSIVVPSLLFALGRRGLAAWILFLLLTAMYFSLSPLLLAAILMTQQVAVAFFFHVFATPVPAVEHPKVPTLQI